MMKIRKETVLSALIAFCLAVILLSIIPSRSGVGDYGIWLDTNDDGKIDMRDVSAVARAFGSSGTNVTKASIEYDSGWIDISGKAGEYFDVAHNLNSTDIIVDITGKRTLSGGTHQESLGGAGFVYLRGRTYGGIEHDSAHALIRTVDGGYALAGQTYSYGSGNGDAYLVKTDADGVMQWNTTYGGTEGDWAEALVQTADGGYALAGVTYSFGENGAVYLVKTDANGVMQWNKTYAGTDSAWADSVVQTADGGYALAGYTMRSGPYGDLEDAYLVKTDADGNLLWNRTYGGELRDYAYALVQTGDGGYTLVGETSSFSWPSNDANIYLVKTDADGNMQWNRTYGGRNSPRAVGRNLVQTTDGGYAIVGQTRLSGLPFDSIYLVRTDSVGDMLWNRTYGESAEGYESSVGFSVVQTTDGGYAMTGDISMPYGGNVYLVKTDTDGNMQWSRTYGGESNSRAYALVQTVDGGYVLAGYTDLFSAGSNDAYLVKTDASGNELWIRDWFRYGLVWTNSTAETITLYRGREDSDWNFVRVRLWKPR